MCVENRKLYVKLYEDMTRELITEKRFQMMSARYDSEQEELSARIKEFEKSAIEDREMLSFYYHKNKPKILAFSNFFG